VAVLLATWLLLWLHRNRSRVCEYLCNNTGKVFGSTEWAPESSLGMNIFVTMKCLDQQRDLHDVFYDMLVYRYLSRL
jgi:hypothetical protein